MDLAQMEGIEACTLAQGPQTLRDRIDRICFKRGIPGSNPGPYKSQKEFWGVKSLEPKSCLQQARL